jgi:hypothetical protein
LDTIPRGVTGEGLAGSFFVRDFRPVGETWSSGTLIGSHASQHLDFQPSGKTSWGGLARNLATWLLYQQVSDKLTVLIPRRMTDNTAGRSPSRIGALQPQAGLELFAVRGIRMTGVPWSLLPKILALLFVGAMPNASGPAHAAAPQDHLSRIWDALPNVPTRTRLLLTLNDGA